MIVVVVSTGVVVVVTGFVHRAPHAARFVSLPRSSVWAAAEIVDRSLLSAAEACTQAGAFSSDDGTPSEGIMLERLRLPARHRGAGLRSMAWLAPIAYCASFATAAPSFFASPVNQPRSPRLTVTAVETVNNLNN